MIEWLKRLLFSKQMTELARIEQALNEKIADISLIYTSIRTFPKMDKQYYAWIDGILRADEYRFMIFDLRENIIRNLQPEKDQNQFVRYQGMLDSIAFIDNYLNTYKREYENKVRADNEKRSQNG